uniref:RsmE family RNA methyltransferase n=1 Tax=Ornithobacterium rhinotracheale TaxID=28251 RepID=UPI0039A543BC
MHLFIGIKQESQALLNENESHHLAKVLRLKVGDTVLFTEGKGEMFLAKILQVHPKNTLLQITEKTDYNQSRNYRLHVGIAPTKNIDRTEWFLEKAIEIGIDEVSFLETFHSERRNLKLDRMQRVAMAAIKQSLKAENTQLHDLIKFSDFIAKYDGFQGQKFIAHCNSDFDRKDIKNCITPQGDYLFLIGPEGDFSAEEIKLAIAHNFTPISLGNQRMRTETAALSTAFIANWVNK